MKRNLWILGSLFAAASCCFAEEIHRIANGVIAVPQLTPKPIAVSGVATPVLDLGGKWRFNHDVKPDAWQGEVDQSTSKQT